MGMRISSAGANGGVQATTTANWQQNQQNYKTMVNAIQSGNLTTAQTAYAALTAGKTPPANSPLAQLGQAIASGSPAAAQQALQTLQAARGASHHHHHAVDPSTMPAAQAGTTATPLGSAVTASPSASGTLLDVVA